MFGTGCAQMKFSFTVDGEKKGSRQVREKMASLWAFVVEVAVSALSSLKRRLQPPLLTIF
jgi:hypothetical protein